MTHTRRTGEEQMRNSVHLRWMFPFLLFLFLPLLWLSCDGWSFCNYSSHEHRRGAEPYSDTFNSDNVSRLDWHWSWIPTHLVHHTPLQYAKGTQDNWINSRVPLKVNSDPQEVINHLHCALFLSVSLLMVVVLVEVVLESLILNFQLLMVCVNNLKTINRNPAVYLSLASCLWPPTPDNVLTVSWTERRPTAAAAAAKQLTPPLIN